MNTLRLSNIRLSGTALRCAALLLAIFFSLAGAPAQQAKDEYGRNYLRMEIAGQRIENLVMNQKYRGWLQVEVVRARGTPSTKNAPQVSKPDRDSWKELPQLLQAGRAGAGEINFGAGDNGRLAPLINAQKQHSLIKLAELHLYAEDGGAFIGKYRLHGIRVLALKDVPASACAMYLVTMSFESVEKI